MGKINEIQEQVTQSFGNNSFTTKITDTTVEFDSARDSFTFKDEVNVPVIKVDGVQSAPFTAEEKAKLATVTTPMNMKGRVDTAAELPTEGVQVGDVYLVGESGSENFEEYVCTEISGSPEAPVWECLGKAVEPQVQADWNQSDSSKVDYIKNKPTIPDAQVQSDWNQTNSSAVDFIKNKIAYKNPDIIYCDLSYDQPSQYTFDFDFQIGLTVGALYNVYMTIDGTDYSQSSIGTSTGGTITVYTAKGNIEYSSSSSFNTHNGRWTGMPGITALKVYQTSIKTLDPDLLGVYIRKGTGNVSVVLNNYDFNVASGDYSLAEGYSSEASGNYSHGESSGKATGNYSHAEGSSIASGEYSHAEGSGATASGSRAHAEGHNTTASGDYSHTEGRTTKATGAYSHAEGDGNTASGNNSHAEGDHTYADSGSQHVFGEYNISDNFRTGYNEWVAGTSYAVGNIVIKDNAKYQCTTANSDTSWRATHWTHLGSHGNYVEIVGNGTSNNARSNARTLDWSGNEQIAGTLRIGSTSTGGVILKEDSGALKISFDNGTTWLTVSAS